MLHRPLEFTQSYDAPGGGFRRFKNFRVVILFYLGKLDLYPHKSRWIQNFQSEFGTLDQAMTELVGTAKTTSKQFGHMPNAPPIKLCETSQ